MALKLVTTLLDELPVGGHRTAAIGAVSDLVSLSDENRTIVLSGLNLLRQTQRIGLQLLLTEAGVPLSI